MTDWFTRSFGTAVSDARRALIEEAWFGRAERPHPASPGGPSREEGAAADPEDRRGIHGWLGRENQQGLGWERFLTDPQREHGIDR